MSIQKRCFLEDWVQENVSEIDSMWVCSNITQNDVRRQNLSLNQTAALSLRTKSEVTNYRKQLKEQLKALQKSPSPPRNKLNKRVFTTASVFCVAATPQSKLTFTPEPLSKNSLNCSKVNQNAHPHEGIRERIKKRYEERTKNKTNKLQHFLKAVKQNPNGTIFVRKNKNTLCNILC